jgi:DNA-binding transcriptional MerR regulator
MTMGADDTFTIDELAQAAGMTPRNVRAYRTKGLLPPPIRDGRASSYRTAHLHRLRHIRELREAGLPLKLIIEAAQRGDDLSPRGPLSRLTATLAPPADRRDTGDDVTPRAIDAVPHNEGAPAFDISPGSPAAMLVQRLSGHGVSDSTILAILLRASRAGRALSADLGNLLCSDLLAASPEELPRPLLQDTAELAIALAQKTLTEALALGA